MIDLRAGPERLGERRGPDRRDHELLHVDVRVGVGATVEDVHHRHRQEVRVGAAQVAVERQLGGDRGGLGDGQRHAEDRVGAQVGLVRGAVQVEHLLVDQPLPVGFVAEQLVGQLVLDVADRLLDTFAQVATLVAVTQLDRLEGAGGRPGRDRGAADRAVVQADLDLDGRIASRVQDLPGDDHFDGGHLSCGSLCSYGCRARLQGRLCSCAAGTATLRPTIREA